MVDMKPNRGCYLLPTCQCCPSVHRRYRLVTLDNSVISNYPLDIYTAWSSSVAGKVGGEVWGKIINTRVMTVVL